jgi:hypothetical protein
MIIMSKFAKRLRKLIKNPTNAVVLGQGFGQLPEIIDLFKTVFLFSWKAPATKSKNLVFRENFDDIEPLTEISVIFIDLDQLHHLEKLKPLWTKCHPLILIEGNTPIDRELSGPLYKAHFKCVDLQGIYHVWKQ